MATLFDVLTDCGVGSLGVLDVQVDVPVVAAGSHPQRQGDVLVAHRPALPAAGTPIPAGGVTVVRGEATGNTHTLHSWDGLCFFDVDRFGGRVGLRLGTLTVPDGASAYLVHTEEHGANGIGPGTYELRSKREWAGVWRAVAD